MRSWPSSNRGWREVGNSELGVETEPSDLSCVCGGKGVVGGEGQVLPPPGQLMRPGQLGA